MPRLVPASHQTIVSCSGRALYWPRTKPSPVVVAVPCAGLAQVIPQARRDARSSVRKRRTSERLSMLCLSTYVNDRIRLGCSLVRTLERASQLLGGIIACVTYYSLVLACEAGPRRGPYSFFFFCLGGGLRKRRPLQVGSGLLQSRGRPIVPVSSGRDAGSVPVYMHTPNAIKSHSSRDASWCVHIKVSTISVPDFHACQPQSQTCICSLGV